MLIYGQLYNGEFAKSYGHASTDERPLCHMPHSCTHISGECPDHETLCISRHKAACQLVHAAIRKTAKGGGALYGSPDLVLVMADTGTQPMNIGDYIDSLYLTSDETNLSPTAETLPQDWFVPTSAHVGGDPP